jgi:PST family polysaccharide transporter
MPVGGAPVKSTVQGGLHGRPPAGGPAAAGLIGRGVLWLLGSVVAARRGTLVLGIIAGRVFTPGQFGAVAAAVVVVLAFRSLGEFGASRALERYEGDPREIAPAVMTISVVSGAALAALCFITSTALAGAAGTAAAAPLIRILAFDILIGGLVAAPAAMLRLHPRGIRRSLADQSGNWLGVALTCWLAVSGHGMLSFGIGLLAGAILRAIMIVIFAPTSLRMGLGRGHMRLLAGSALPLAGSGLAMFALLNADQLIVGHLKGAASLGCYALAVSLASWPITLLAEPVLRAAPGSFARLRTSPQLQGSAYLSSAALLASLTLPAGFLLSAMAVPLLHLAYGPEWAPAAKALEWLAPLVALRLLCKLTSDYLTEFKGAVSALIFQLVWLAAMIPSVIVWTWVDGIAGAAMAQVVIAGARLLPWYLVETRWLSRGRGQVMRIIVPLAAGLTVAFVVIWVRRVVPDDGVDLGLGGLAGLTAVGLLVYRMRSVLAAVQRTAAVSTAWSFARAASPVLEAVIESPGRPMWSGSGVSQRTQILAPVPALVPAAETAQAGLGRKVRSGARWSMVNTLVLRVANFTVGVVLARTVFGPQAWGLYAISQLVLSVVLSANEMGVSLAVVRLEGDIRRIARTALTLSLASSTALCALLFFFAPTVASFLGSPGATSLVRLLSLCVIIDGFVCVPFSLINREFMQGRRLVVEAAGFVVTTAVTLLLAFAHLGAISFAWGNVAGNVVTLIGATVAAPFIVLPGWDRRRARELLKFGMPLAGASLLVLGTLNVDSAIVSATLGPAALGFYQLAFNISSWPVQSISAAARRVSFAGFSRLAGSRELLADGFTKAAAVLVALAIPACVLLITLSEPLIKTIYGARWTPAAESLSLLGVLGLLRVFYELAYDGLAAADRRPTLLVVQGLWLVVLIPVLLVGAATHGINGVSAGHVLVAVLVVGPAFLWSLRRIGITIGALLRRCLRPIIGGILMAVVSLAIIHFAGSGIVGLGAAVVAAGVVYVPLILPMRHLIRQNPQQPAEVAAARAA